MNKLYVTYCCADKEAGFHPPETLYKSPRIKRFTKKCNELKLDWAIFSALYGFVFPDDEKKDYNVTLRTDRNYWLNVAVYKNQMKLSNNRSEEHNLELIHKLKKQIVERHFDTIIFYGPSPKMMKSYLTILHNSFDNCEQLHGWKDLVEHVRNQSKTIRIIHQIDEIL